MISEQEALARILHETAPLPGRNVALAEALNCFLAEDVVAKTPLPNFDNSAMDGYAVVASDCHPGGRLKLTGEQPAGIDRHLRISSGETIRIFTGAPMPVGADAVVMQEDVTPNGSEIIINTDVEPGEFIRRRGSDLAAGQKIAGKGERLRAVMLAALGAQGFDQVAIGGPVTAAVLSTGDELVSPGGDLEPGQIYDSNSLLLRSLLVSCGADVRSVEHCPDREDALIAALRRGSENKVLLISGGVSVGQHDLVKSALGALGAQIDLWRVAIKPGKPFLFGRAGECSVFGLPGNPVSSFVTFLKFVRPAILRMMGASNEELPLRRVTSRLTEAISGSGDRPHYIRGRLIDGQFTPIGRQESHALFGLSRSNALLRVPPSAELQAADLVEVEIWD
ncbi:MAG TPA: gephyrin-like molybdotransferase Glp [Chthoniobacterales bacterium]|jgi:molybdopterin molybdotransferase